jgi:hypothetical protein
MLLLLLEATVVAGITYWLTGDLKFVAIAFFGTLVAFGKDIVFGGKKAPPSSQKQPPSVGP